MSAVVEAHDAAEALRVGLAPVADRPVWVSWRLVHMPGKLKPSKIPHWRGGGELKGVGAYSDPTLPDRLMTLDEASLQADKLAHNGVGIAFYAGCGVVGLDLDNAIGPDGQATLKPEQRAAFEVFKQSGAFVEYSVSGTGVHAICVGDACTLKHDGAVELFGDRNFLALTGNGKGVACRITPGGVARVTAAVQASKARAAGMDPTRTAEVLKLPSSLNRQATQGPASPEGMEDPARVRSALFSGSPPADRDSWMRLVWAARHALGASGEALAREWSETDRDNYDEAAFDNVWNSYRPREGGITAASLYSWARGNGWTDPTIGKTSNPGLPVSADDLARIAAGAPTLPPKRFTLRTGADLGLMPDTEWLVRGLVPATGIGALIGQPGAGKSFTALDMAFKVAAGQPWFGLRIRKAHPVVYVALEGAGGMKSRLLAYCKHHDIEQAPEGLRFVIRESLQLASAEDLAGLIESINDLRLESPLVIVDTLAQAAVGLDENAGKDMGPVIAGMQSIAYGTGGFCLAVGHTGKDESRGIRGWSGQYAAFDVCIRVVRDKGTFPLFQERRYWVADKVKDGEDGITRHFDLTPVDLGVDRYGDRMGSLVVTPCNAPQPSSAGSKLSAQAAEALNTLTALIDSEGAEGLEGAPEGVRAVPTEDVRQALQSTFGHVQSKHRSTVITRALKALGDAKRVVFGPDSVWVAAEGASGNE